MSSSLRRPKPIKALRPLAGQAAWQTGEKRAVILVRLIGLLSSSLRFSVTAKAIAVAASRQITNTVGASLVKALDLRDARYP